MSIGLTREEFDEVIADATEETARHCMAIALAAVGDERLSDETGTPEDVSYNNAIADAVNALRIAFDVAFPELRL